MSSADVKMEKHSPQYSRFLGSALLQCNRVIVLNTRLKDLLFVFMLGVLCPTVIFAFVNKKSEPEKMQETIRKETTVLEETKPKEYFLRVVVDSDKIENMELDTYLTSVVLREMPASFEKEALKAQAVVARTYALRRQESGGKHIGADVCTSPSCCQGYCTIEEFVANGGTQEEIEKVKDAVMSTKNQVLTYKGKLTEATYFSCSGGLTEDAQAVWGSDIPYLQSVESPGEENAGAFTDTVSLSVNEFKNKLGSNLSGKPESWIEGVTYTDGGGVDTITICGAKYKGTEFRSLLGLRSTSFVITIVGDSITITTKGYGHRVGMSQYGADAMAVKGSNYKEILAHYYVGTQISQYEG